MSAENKGFSSECQTDTHVLAPKSDLESAELKAEALKALTQALVPPGKSGVREEAALKSLVLRNPSGADYYFVFLLLSGKKGGQELMGFEINSRTSRVVEKSRWDYSKDFKQALNPENILRSMPEYYKKKIPGMVKSFYYGELFLKDKFKDLHTSLEALNAKEKRERETGEKTGTKPQEIIRNYLLQFKEEISDQEKMHELYVIKPENIPESYFKLQKKIAREQGRGDIKISESVKKQLTEAVITDQISTLDNWLDYFVSSDSDFYPDWAKYWAFRSMVRLSTYDKEKRIFAKRDQNTVATFPDLNREALAYVMDLMIKKAEGKPIAVNGDEDFEQLLQGENFGKLYAYALEKVRPSENKAEEDTSGKWVTYLQGSDPLPLVQSLQGFGTGWCTAGESTAQIQLSYGDFYVYYSNDKHGKPAIPRIAIRMEGNSIAEVRGIGPEQNLDPDIIDIAEKKLQEFPDGPEYQKKTKDMKHLTEIDEKQKTGAKLDRNDLIFLYETENKIEGFGYKRDPRIEELKSKRKNVMKEDYALIYGVREDEVIDNIKDLKADIKIYTGFDIYTPENTISVKELEVLSRIIGLKINLTNVDQSVKNKLVSWKGTLIDKGVNVSYPKLKEVGMDFDARYASELKLNSLQRVGRSIYIRNAKKMKLGALQHVGVDLDVRDVKNFKTESLQTVGGFIFARNVPEFKASSLQHVGGSIEADNAQIFSTPSLISVGRDLNAKRARQFDADSLESVGGSLEVPKATEFKISSLKTVGGSINAGKIKKFKADSLQRVGEFLDVINATEFKADSLKHVGRDLIASRAKIFKADSLKIVGMSLYASSAVEFKIDSLQHVGGHLDGRSATEFSARSLIKVGRDLYATDALEFKADFLQHVGGLLEVNSAEEFKPDSLESVGGSVFVRSAKNFTLASLQHVGGFLNAESAKEFNVPSLQHVEMSINASLAEEFKANSLITVGWSLDARSALKFQAKSLKTIGMDLNACSAIRFNAPNLQYVKGEIMVLQADLVKVIMANNTLISA